jgi:hypothetical protein
VTSADPGSGQNCTYTLEENLTGLRTLGCLFQNILDILTSNHNGVVPRELSENFDVWGVDTRLHTPAPRVLHIKSHHQVFWGVLIDLIVEMLVLIIKSIAEIQYQMI